MIKDKKNQRKEREEKEDNFILCRNSIAIFCYAFVLFAIFMFNLKLVSLDYRLLLSS